MLLFAWAPVGTAALNLLKVVWKPLVIGVGGIAIAHAVYYGPKIENKNLRIELKNQEVIRLTEMVKDQNAEIQDASDRSMKEFGEMLDALREDLDKRESKSEETIKRILDSVTPENCTELTNFLIEQVDNLQWEDG